MDFDSELDKIFDLLHAHGWDDESMNADRFLAELLEAHYRDGREDGKIDSLKDYDQGWEAGYEHGYDNGYASGADTGY